MTLDDLTIVIPHHDQHRMLADALTDLNMVKNIVIVRGGTFAENCNNGFKLVKTKYVCFLNDDVRINDAHILLGDMISLLKKYQIVGCRVEKGVNGFRIEKNKMIPVYSPKEKMDIPSGHCLMFKVNTFKTLKGYDEDFKNGCEDGNLYMRALQMGMKIGASDITMQHIGCQSSGRLSHIDQNVLLYNKRWGAIARDPYKAINRDNWETL